MRSGYKNLSVFFFFLSTVVTILSSKALKSVTAFIALIRFCVCMYRSN